MTYSTTPLPGNHGMFLIRTGLPFVLFALLVFGGCDMFDKGLTVRTTVVEGVAVEQGTGVPLARIGVGIRSTRGNGAVRPLLTSDSTGADGRFRIVYESTLTEDYQVAVWDMRLSDPGYAPEYYARSDDGPRFVRLGSSTEVRIEMRLIER